MDKSITLNNAFLPLVGEALLHRGLADMGVVTVVFPSVKLALRHPEGAMSKAIDNFRSRVAIIYKVDNERSEWFK